MSHTFKILSLDGGGVKGLYTAKILSHFESKFGGHIGEYFDMICGTSTGGLLALALSQRIPAIRIVEFYKEQGPKIFTTHKFLNEKRGMFRQMAGSGKYPNTNLATAVSAVLGDVKMQDAQNLLCIPTFNLSKGRPRVFKYPHKEGGHSLDKYGSMLDAALATSAAPTYFPAKYFNGCYYADGGVWANNPTLCGVMEALDHFIGDDKRLHAPNDGIKFTKYSVLSIGCLPKDNGWAATGHTDDLPMSALDWKDGLFETSLDGQSHFADNFASKLINQTKAPGSYYRIGNPRSLSAAQQAILKLDNASPEALQELERLGDDVGDDHCTRKKGLIEHFFQHKKTYKTQ